MKVRCEVCGKEFEFIAYAHLKTHGITMSEYRNQFPDALLISESCRKKLSEAKLGKPSGMKGKKAWNKGLTKETNESVKKYGEKSSKTKKAFFASEEGQKYLDEHLRDENNPMHDKHHTEESNQKNREANLGENNGNFGKKHPGMNAGEKNGMHGVTDEDSPVWNGGRAAAEERRRGFGFIPLNEKFSGSAAHHLNKELVLYIPKLLHQSVYHNMHTGQGMEEINNLACEYVYGIDIGGEKNKR